MKNYYSHIPTYEEIRKCNKKEEHIWNLFDVIGSGYFRITYNEDFRGMISIDFMEDGYLHATFLPIYDKTDIVENKLYKFNKTNYTKIIEFIILVKESIIKELNDIKWG